MNADGAINVTDIVSVVNYILGGGTALNSGAEEAIITIAGNQVSVRGVDDKAISGIQLTLSHSIDFEYDFVAVNNAQFEYAYEIEDDDEYTTELFVVKRDLNVIFTATKGEFEIVDSPKNVVVNEKGVEIEFRTSYEVVDFQLKAAYPNPFNPTTNLQLVLPEAGYVSIKIYNLVGQEVATLAEGMMEANSGGYTFQWNASNMASGVYLVRAEGAGQVATQKLMLLK